MPDWPALLRFEPLSGRKEGPRGDRAPRPFEEGRLIGGGLEQDVRIEEDHGSRVMAFRESQVIFGRRGAASMASNDLYLQSVGRERPIEKVLVDQLRGNWSSVLAWLREVLAWGRPTAAESPQRP